MDIHHHVIVTGGPTLFCLLMIVSCGHFKIEDQTSNSNSTTLRQLEERINRLEQNIRDRSSIPAKPDTNNVPPGPIKSLTFRVGTIDDRLRVYWSDGRTSDLPCTKDESVWACG